MTTTTPATGAPAAKEERVITFGDVFGRDAGGIIVLLILFGGMTLASDQFLTADNLANLARQVAIFGIIAVGRAPGHPDRRHRPVGRGRSSACPAV